MPVYLIHLDKPLGHSQHYVGYALSLRTLPERIKHHQSGNGARFLQVANDRAIIYSVVRVWKTATREFERFLKKKYKCNRQICPVCNPDSWSKNLPESKTTIMED